MSNLQKFKDDTLTSKKGISKHRKTVNNIEDNFYNEFSFFPKDVLTILDRCGIIVTTEDTQALTIRNSHEFTIIFKCDYIDSLDEMIYVLFHECAHIHLSHFDGKPKTPAQSSKEEKEAENKVVGWFNEYHLNKTSSP